MNTGFISRIRTAWTRLEAWLDAIPPKFTDDDARFARITYSLIAVWFLLWSILPSMCVGNAFIDVSENYAWGQNFQWGYDKNPYFGAWLTYWTQHLLGDWSLDFLSYFMSQISVCMALLSMFSLGTRIFRSGFCALLGVILMLTVPFFSHGACEYNDDVIEIGLWAALILFFHRAVFRQKLSDWAVVGISAGLALMTKYLGIVLFVPLWLMLLITPEGRASWKKPGIYLSILLFLVLIVPNFIWLYRNDFIAFQYAADRARLCGDTVTTSDHFFRPLSTLGEILVRLLLPAAVLFLLFRRNKQAKLLRFDRIYLILVMWLPILALLVFSAISGGKVISSWLTPFFIVSGLFLMSLWTPENPGARRFAILSIFFLLFTVILSGNFAFEFLVKRPYLRRNVAYDAYPGRTLADMATKIWHDTLGDIPLRYVIATRREACNMTFYAKEHPVSYFDALPAFSPWIDESEVERDGAVILWGAHYPVLPHYFPKYEGKILFLQEPVTVNRAVAGWFKKLIGKETPEEKMWIAILIPESKRSEFLPSPNPVPQPSPHPHRPRH